MEPETFRISQAGQKLEGGTSDRPDTETLIQRTGIPFSVHRVGKRRAPVTTPTDYILLFSGSSIMTRCCLYMSTIRANFFGLAKNSRGGCIHLVVSLFATGQTLVESLSGDAQQRGGHTLVAFAGTQGVMQ